MIYFITQQPQYIDTEQYKVISVEQSLTILSSMQVVGLDTETNSLDIWTGKLITFQLGNNDNQIVIDCSTVDILAYKDFLESDRLFVIHNAKFDLKWLYKKHILIKHLFDTYLAEKILRLGFLAGQVSLSLQACCKRYLDVTLDKTVTTTFANSNINFSQLQYAADDVKYLEQVMNKQCEVLNRRNQLVACDIENEFVKVLAYIEYCGIKLDKDRWTEKMLHDEKKVQQAKEQLDKWIIDYVVTNNKPIFTNYDNSIKSLDLVTNKKIYVVIPVSTLFDVEPPTMQCIIDWNSPLQMITLFKELGFDLTTKDRKTGKYRESVDLKIISKQSEKSTIVPLYIEYSKAFKVVSAFGQNYINAINTVTDRIHPQFNQLMDTGRVSCGSKNGDSVNIQQLPNNAETREAFVAEEGNMLIDCDYKEQEGYCFAELSNDQSWIAFYNDINPRDGHSFVAKMCFPDELRDIAELDVKKQRKDLRALAKSARFCFNYNGSAKTMADSCGIPVEQAEKIYKNYFEQFNGIASYFKQQKKLLWERGYILISSITGLRSYVYNYPTLKGIMDRQKNTENFWDIYREAKNSGIVDNKVPQAVIHQVAEKFAQNIPLEDIAGEYSYVTAKGDTSGLYVNKNTALICAMKYLWKEKAEWENSCCNYPTQGTSAAMTKIAITKYFNHLIQDNLLFKVKIVNYVHDENLIEAPQELAEQEAHVLSQCMKEAATVFCKKVTLSTDPLIAPVWKH